MQDSIIYTHILLFMCSEKSMHKLINEYVNKKLSFSFYVFALCTNEKGFKTQIHNGRGFITGSYFKSFASLS